MRWSGGGCPFKEFNVSLTCFIARLWYFKRVMVKARLAFESLEREKHNLAAFDI
jgi:hypothetical protein